MNELLLLHLYQVPVLVPLFFMLRLRALSVFELLLLLLHVLLPLVLVSKMLLLPLLLRHPLSHPLSPLLHLHSFHSN